MKSKIIQSFSSMMSGGLLLFCTFFVIFKGYQCFSKFHEKPEVISIKYGFTGELSFPVITLCPYSVSRYKNGKNGEMLYRKHDLNVHDFYRILKFSALSSMQN